jgi:hypothetical protein
MRAELEHEGVGMIKEALAECSKKLKGKEVRNSNPWQ